MSIVGAIVFGALALAGGLLSAEELVRLRRRGGAWHAMFTPAALRFCTAFSVVWVGLFWLTVIWGNFPALCTVATIMAATLAWNVWLAVRMRRVPRPGR